jgi:hypothetical protein
MSATLDYTDAPFVRCGKNLKKYLYKFCDFGRYACLFLICNITGQLRENESYEVINEICRQNSALAIVKVVDTYWCLCGAQHKIHIH